jgi:hypothetical protein
LSALAFDDSLLSGSSRVAPTCAWPRALLPLFVTHSATRDIGCTWLTSAGRDERDRPTRLRSQYLDLQPAIDKKPFAFCHIDQSPSQPALARLAIQRLVGALRRRQTTLGPSRMGEALGYCAHMPQGS